MSKSKSQLRREAAMAEDTHDADTGVEAPTPSETAAPAAQPTMRLRLLQNHFVAGVLKRTGETVELPTAVAEKELRVTRGIYETA